MNRRVFIFLGILCVSLLSACHKVEYEGQTGRIYHKEYNPALNINYILDTVAQTWDTIRIDLDKDNETDLKICFQYDTPYLIALKDWELSVTTDGNISSLNWWSKDYHVFMGHITAICLRNNTAEGPIRNRCLQRSRRLQGDDRLPQLPRPEQGEEDLHRARRPRGPEVLQTHAAQGRMG